MQHGNRFSEGKNSHMHSPEVELAVPVISSPDIENHGQLLQRF